LTSYHILGHHYEGSYQVGIPKEGKIDGPDLRGSECENGIIENQNT
jgi:hypothetical protein